MHRYIAYYKLATMAYQQWRAGNPEVSLFDVLYWDERLVQAYERLCFMYEPAWQE